MVRDLAALASPRARALATALRDILREVHFDQINHDLRLPRYGGDYDIRPFPLPSSAVDQQEHEGPLARRGEVVAPFG